MQQMEFHNSAFLQFAKRRKFLRRGPATSKAKDASMKMLGVEGKEGEGESSQNIEGAIKDKAKDETFIRGLDSFAKEHKDELRDMPDEELADMEKIPGMENVVKVARYEDYGADPTEYPIHRDLKQALIKGMAATF